MTEPTNEDHCNHAVTALFAFANESGQNMSDGEPVIIQDLLTDLMHLCRRQGYDFREILDIAERRFTEEVFEEEGA